MDGIRYKFIVAAGIFDIPAKSKILNVSQFNGKYGCNYCFHPGTLANKKYIRYSHNRNTHYQSRSNKNQRKLMKLAHDTETKQYGVKGMSPLIALPNFDVVNQLPIDYMHNCLLGVVKMLNSLWFDSKNHSKIYYLGQRSKKIEFNRRFTRIRSFFEISRQPRNIMNTSKLKANEYKNWLLYISSSCLCGLLPKAYYDHFQIFREAIGKLLQPNIDIDELLEIQTNLNFFVQQFENLYGTENMTFNIHLLTHLTGHVKMFGPL